MPEQYHTPGPYHVFETVEGHKQTVRIIAPPVAGSVLDEGGRTGDALEIATVHRFCGATGQELPRDANARLLAASWNLLAACEAMLSAYADYHVIRTSEYESGKIEMGTEQEYRAYNMARAAVALTHEESEQANG